jgi:opacity protein-like surface antigen
MCIVVNKPINRIFLTMKMVIIAFLFLEACLTVFADPVDGQLSFDRDDLRPYLTLRYGAVFMDSEAAPQVDIDDVTQAASGSVGLGIGRYISLEVAFDGWENDLSMPNLGKVSEYAVWTVIPQIRLRYPLLSDRVVPSLAAGYGWGLTEANDPKKDGVSAFGEDTGYAYSVSGGLEYFVAQNISIGTEVKYIANESTVFLGGAERTLDLDALVTSAGLSIYFTPAPAGSPLSRVTWYDAGPLFVSLRGGFPYFLDTDFSSGFEISDSEVQLLLSGLIGVDISDRWGLGVAVNYYETGLSHNGGKVGELNMTTVSLLVRFSQPITDRLLTYIVGGAGPGYATFNDRAVGMEPGDPRIGGNHLAFTATVGTGIDLFIADNLALNLEADYIYHDSELDINGKDEHIDLGALLLSGGFRILF